MAIIQGWLPPSRENYELAVKLFTLFPLFASLQWAVSWYGMGKTSVQSRFNLPGRIGWFTMEAPGFLTLLYIMNTLPAQNGIKELPWQNKVLGGLFVMHYLYRALLFPIIQPSMSPIHFLVWGFALAFQLFNGVGIGGWLAAYGPTTQEEWQAYNPSVWQFGIGVVVFYVGLTSNYFCDEELRELRRKEQRRQEKLASKGVRNIAKHYEVPQNFLFKYLLYPHYFMEWIEWSGFWMAAGLTCVPARNFLINEIAAMFPRAVSGKKWYKEKFGEDKIRGKWAVVPGVW